MILPFALVIGVGMALGIAALPVAWVLAAAAACAGLYMWNTRAPAEATATPPTKGAASLVGWLIAFAGVISLTSLIGGAGYLLGRFFGWARLDA